MKKVIKPINKKNYCDKCDGSKSAFADDYFIPKCWCDEILNSYQQDYDDDPYGDF